MRVAIIGTGYVGLVSGTCFAEFGHTVTCVDNDLTKIKSLQNGVVPIFESGLEDLLNSNISHGRLFFTDDISKAIEDAEVVFLAVGTPSRRGDGHADLSYVYVAAEEIAKVAKDYKVIVTKSTVPVGTGKKIAEIINTANPGLDFDIVSNPEFLREGSAINDFMRPDRVIVGTESERAKEIMRELYRPLYLNETPILFTSIESAEITKYAANAFLATKIAFINEFANLCEVCDADIQDVARGIGLDGRISKKFLNAGPGYGGSCFPKDTRAIIKTAQDLGQNLTIVETVAKSNEIRKSAMANRIIEACGGSVKNKTIAILGVTFKPNTDDVRESPSIDIIKTLQEAGAKIQAYDPEGMKEADKLLDNIQWFDDAYMAITDCNAMVIITEWNEFRALDLEHVKKALKEPVVIDLRNVYNPEQMKKYGFNYFSIGRENILNNIKVLKAAI